MSGDFSKLTGRRRRALEAVIAAADACYDLGTDERGELLDRAASSGTDSDNGQWVDNLVVDWLQALVDQ